MKTWVRHWLLPLSLPAALAGLLLVHPSGCPPRGLEGRGRLERHVGGEVDFASLRGKVLVVNFWATWCAPCNEELPALLRVMDSFESQGAVLLAINQDGGDQTREAVEEFLLKNPSTLRARVYYGDKTFLGQFRVDGLPTTYVLDRKGDVVERFVGAVTEPALRQALQRALQRA